MSPDLVSLLAEDEPSPGGADLKELLVLFERVAGETAAEDFRNALCRIVLRAIEIELLSSPEMIDMALNPGIYLGSEKRLIADHLQLRLGVAPDDVVAHYRRLVLSGAAGSSGKLNAEPYAENVFRLYWKRDTQLRCVICGYHFVEQDLGSSRREIVRDIGLELAAEQLSRRLRDPWKSPDKTALELDHWIPEAGLGPTEANNLRIVCKFCNTNKSVWRWPSEMTPASVASCLLVLGETSPGSRGYKSAEAATFHAIALRRMCYVCRRGPREVELTALVVDRGRCPARPWSLQAACYDCYEPESGTVRVAPDEARVANDPATFTELSSTPKRPKTVDSGIDHS